MIFVGIDWAEHHHDVCLLDADGGELDHARITDGAAGARRLHELIARHTDDPDQVVVGIETDHGLLVTALLATGYRMHAINPMAAARYRERYATSRAKSDRADARVLADVVRLDRHRHRPIATDSDHAEAIKALARAHQQLIWARQRQVNVLRSHLREFYPAALQAFDDLTARDALAVLAKAPTPQAGRALTRAQTTAALRRGGRQRYLPTRVERIQTALRSEHLEAAPMLTTAFGHAVQALVGVIAELTARIDALEEQVNRLLDAHPDAQVVRSLPGLGGVVAARLLGEFGDAPGRFTDAKARKAYAGTAPVTRASGTRQVVLARVARNRRLFDACYQWAFAAIRCSPGARALYDRRRAAGAGHHEALRVLANRLVGIYHGCLRHHTRYDEQRAWGVRIRAAA
ncbi:IS110 family transposase [Planomonospora sp. ID67723]|uniref:IS110 family transposase n=1 Tax=Planomonospora sp. ID67723 TaxID=2738134 RepID=UPI0018C41431|nr:IS110 family transposase [Planomonospora sp. ID67723]MBG0831628.1 IS110 family transposase [Planomonospora sp. ID67723]